jgi:SAM-dependent methyltransferase
MANKIDFKQSWSKLTDSGHRADDHSCYHRKALEHALIIGEHAEKPSVDLGCGAGELLCELTKHLNFTEAVDFSDLMLAQASQRLSGLGIDFNNQDVFEYMETSTQLNWVFCESLNQYLDPNQQLRVIDAFANNSSVENLYLFDTICPVCYDLWRELKVLSFISAERVKYLSGVGAFVLGLMKAMFAPQLLDNSKL